MAIHVGKTAHRLAARDNIRLARHFFNRITRDGWQLNQDQIEILRDWAHDARHEARDHLLAALAA